MGESSLRAPCSTVPLHVRVAETPTMEKMSLPVILSFRTKY